MRTGRRFAAGKLIIADIIIIQLHFISGEKLTTAEGDEIASGQLLPGEDAAISLPPSLFVNTGDVGMFFGLYRTATLFPITGQSSGGREIRVFSHVLAATVGQNVNISNLKDRVTIAFKSQPTTEEGLVSSNNLCS